MERERLEDSRGMGEERETDTYNQMQTYLFYIPPLLPTSPPPPLPPLPPEPSHLAHPSHENPCQPPYPYCTVRCPYSEFVVSPRRYNTLKFYDLRVQCDNPYDVINPYDRKTRTSPTYFNLSFVVLSIVDACNLHYNSYYSY